MTTVLNARDLQNRYMCGSGSAALIDASEFNATYGRYAIYAAASVLQERSRDHGGQIAALAHAREPITEWHDDYNRRRPHTSPGGLTPPEFASRSNQRQTNDGLSL